MPIVDASVFVAAQHAGDRFHRQCLGWLRGALEQQALAAGADLAAPNLLAVETAASLFRLTGSDALAAEAARELWTSTWIRLLPLTSERARAATEVAGMTGVRGADAIYLALARELGQPLITLDRIQLERGRNVAEVARP